MTDLSDFVRFCESLPQQVDKGKLNLKQFYPCGHPRTAENSRPSGFSKAGKPMVRCKQCHKEVNRVWHKR